MGRTRPLRITDLSVKELNPRLRSQLIQFHTGAQASCVEEIVMA